MISRLILFLALNFTALGIGGIFSGKGVPSDWYSNLNKAPWTPPGWTFGLAWTAIMICFAIYMAYLWPAIQNKKLLVGLFAIQWLLNTMWNPVFFHFHNTLLGLVIITGLTLLIGYFLLYYYPVLKIKSALILPYFLWLLVASSLNAYILIQN
jgi:tryptophan-rich sensory protein